MAAGFNQQNQKELMQVSCTLMKSLYENKGQIVLTSEEMLFIYLDQPDPSSQMFFKKPK